MYTVTAPFDRCEPSRQRKRGTTIIYFRIFGIFVHGRIKIDDKHDFIKVIERMRESNTNTIEFRAFRSDHRNL